MTKSPAPTARQEFRQIIARTTYDEAIVSLEAGLTLEDGNWRSPDDLKTHRRRAFRLDLWSWAQFLFYCGIAAAFGFALIALVTVIV